MLQSSVGLQPFPSEPDTAQTLLAPTSAGGSHHGNLFYKVST